MAINTPSSDLISRVDERRLVETVDVPSPTGSEQAIAEHVRDLFDGMGLSVTWQEVEDGRPNSGP